MALLDNAWYIDFGDGLTTGYAAVLPWAVETLAAGAFRRQKTAAVADSQRVFVCTTGGLTTTEPTWVTTRGALNTSGAAVLQECTGVAGANGDATNTPTWTTYKAFTATATLGQLIKRNNGASYWICTIGGAMGGSEPAWANDTAGTTRTDGSATWTCLGVVGNFTGWQAPSPRLRNAFATNWGQVGNSWFLASEHAETSGSSITLVGPGSVNNLATVYCVTKTAVPPTSSNLTTGASISTTGSADIFIQGNCYFQGVTFNVSDSTNSQSLFLSDAAQVITRFKNCAFVIRGTGGSGLISIGGRTGAGDCCVILDNTTMQFAAVGQTVRFSGAQFIWKNTPSAIGGATFPTTFFKNTALFGGSAYLEAVDLGALGSGKTIVGTQSMPLPVSFKDCKLNASVTVATTPTQPGGAEVFVIDCDSGATNYRSEKYAYAGTQTTETTIVRTGGASNGVTPISWKIVTTANSKWIMPFEALPIAIWNTTVGNDVTVTIHGIWGGGAVPNNDDIWMDAEYLGSSLTPQGSFITASKADNLAAGTPLPADAVSTWGGSTTAFSISVLISAPQPAQTGPIYVYVKAAKASSTFYIDPLIVLS